VLNQFDKARSETRSNKKNQPDALDPTEVEAQKEETFVFFQSDSHYAFVIRHDLGILLNDLRNNPEFPGLINWSDAYVHPEH